MLLFGIRVVLGGPTGGGRGEGGLVVSNSYTVMEFSDENINKTNHIKETVFGNCLYYTTLLVSIKLV